MRVSLDDDEDAMDTDDDGETNVRRDQGKRIDVAPSQDSQGGRNGAPEMQATEKDGGMKENEILGGSRGGAEKTCR